MTTDASRPDEGRRVRFLAAIASLAVVVSLAVGCGRSLPPVAPVSGAVTRAGRPVTQGIVAFYPERGRMGVGQIGADGRFTITTFAAGDGAIIGRHRVAIESYTQGAGSSPPAPGDADVVHSSGPIVWIVPEAYASPETTPLTADVKPGSNTIDFAVP